MPSLTRRRSPSPMWGMGAAMVLGWIGIMGCERDAPRPGAANTASAAAPASASAAAPASASAAALAAAAPTIAVFLDGKALPVVTPPAGSTPVVFAPEGLPPRDQWRELVAQSVDGKRQLGLRRFDETYADRVPVLFTHPDGGPSFGLTRAVPPDAPARVKAAASKPQPMIVGVTRIEVRTRETPREGAAPSSLELVVGGRTQAVKAADLAAIPRESPRGAVASGKAGGKRRRRAGWPLAPVLSLGGDLPPIAVLRLATGEGEVTLPWPAPAGERYLLRRNRRGGWQLEIWDATKRRRRLRDLSRVTVTARR